MTTVEHAAPPAPPGQRVTIIEPSRGWRMLDFRDLWSYRELLVVLTARDVKVRYKQTSLGVAWAIIQPVAAMVIFSIVFGRLAGLPSDGYPYPIFTYAALLPWTYFATSIATAGNSLVSSADLVRKVYFPRLFVPLASVGAAIVDFAIATIIMLLLMAYYGIPPTANIIAVPFLLIFTTLAALGIGTLLAALNAAYRDFRYVIPFLVQIWLFATPVAYPASLVPEKWRWVIYLNPMSGLVGGFRSAFLGAPFDLLGLAIAGVVSLIVFIAAVAYFERVERSFADVI
jgi:lipopolysaccharide transport system permease protein